MNIRTQFENDGFYVIPDFFNRKDGHLLQTQAQKIVLNSKSHSFFSAQNRPQDKDPEFLKSANGIHVFWEENADPKMGLAGVNKIAHALHRQDFVFKQFSHQPKIMDLLDEIGYSKPISIQSMYIPKPAIFGGAVGHHQDSSFIQSKPKPCIGLWFALENANKENGCLWVCPKSHKGTLRKLYNRDGDSLSYDLIDKTPYPTNSIPLEVPAGTLILIHGYCVHYSLANNSMHSRHAYTLHFVDQKGLYPEKNWIPYPNDTF
jgi:phytanoyl-CoA hydroxylase